MKTIKTIILAISLCVSYNTVTAQNLKSMPVTKRDSLLIAIAKEVVLKYGPDYYREYKQPIISENRIPPKGELNPDGIDAGKIVYLVTFLYNPAEETLDWDYAAIVGIREDSGQPRTVMFGTGYGRGIPEGMDWRNDTTIEPVPYQAAAIVPLYNMTDDETAEPLNKEELIRKGYVKSNNGQWVKTTPDIPLHKRKQ